LTSLEEAIGAMKGVRAISPDAGYASIPRRMSVYSAIKLSISIQHFRIIHASANRDIFPRQTPA